MFQALKAWLKVLIFKNLKNSISSRQKWLKSLHIWTLICCYFSLQERKLPNNNEKGKFQKTHIWIACKNKRFLLQNQFFKVLIRWKRRAKRDWGFSAEWWLITFRRKCWEKEERNASVPELNALKNDVWNNTKSPNRNWELKSKSRCKSFLSLFKMLESWIRIWKHFLSKQQKLFITNCNEQNLKTPNERLKVLEDVYRPPEQKSSIHFEM